jgi:hypothetical protein
MRYNNLINQKDVLLVNEVVLHHQLGGIPSGQGGIMTSLTKGFPSGTLYLIDRKAFLPVNEVVIPHQPEGIPSGQWGCYLLSTGRISFRSSGSNS